MIQMKQILCLHCLVRKDCYLLNQTGSGLDCVIGVIGPIQTSFLKTVFFHSGIAFVILGNKNELGKFKLVHSIAGKIA